MARLPIAKKEVISKKEIAQESVNDIDYVSLIDGMNEGAFLFCVETLYDYMSFKVLNKEEIRKIDFEEKIIALADELITDESQKGSMNLYVEGIQSYFDEDLPCEENSRAATYKNRAYKLIQGVANNKYTEYDIEDMLMILTSLFREKEDIKAKGAKPNKLSNPDIILSSDDASVLLRIFKETTDEEKPVIVKKKKVSNFGVMSDRLVYITNVIYLSKALQTRGTL